MDLQSNSPPESGKLEQIISQFLLKSLHIILDSRIPSLRPYDHRSYLSSVSGVRKSDKWFNLVLGDRPAALDNLNFWHQNPMDPMIIDIILVHDSSSSVDNLHAPLGVAASVQTVMERWVVRYESSRVLAPQTGESSASYKKMYKKSIILLRSLYSQMRLLPAYRIFCQLNSSSQTYNYSIIYKMSSLSDPFSRAEELVMKEYSFTPVDAIRGHLCVSVTYCTTLSDFNLEPSASFPPNIITDYVGSPATDPRFLPSLKALPLRGIRGPHPVPAQRPHSWTSGFHGAPAFTQNQTLGGSPPAYCTYNVPHDSPSPPTDVYGHRVQNCRPPTHRKTASYDEYQLSPPFSPSPKVYFTGTNRMQTCMRVETAPVTIPFSMTGRNSKYLSPNFSDPSRHPLPPISSRSTKHTPSPQESPSGVRSFRKIEASRVGKDDLGRFSGLVSSSGSTRIGFSRSSSRLSFQDDLDDGDILCAFDFDDVDTSDSQASNLDGVKFSDSTSESPTTGRKSQDAAVGILVHMLRTAPPLRQDPSCSSQSLKTEEFGTASGFFMPRKTADALEELRSYREMKDLLLSKSGTRLISKEA